MTHLAALHALARYNRWMNDALYATAATLSDEARRRDRGAFFRSLHGTFNHLLVADRIWLGRVHGALLPPGDLGPGGIRSLDQELVSDFGDLRRERALTDDALSAWVTGLTEDALAGTLSFTRRGQQVAVPLAWVAHHVFNHQTHHRGQITTLLHQQGCDPGSTDLFAMLLQEQRAG